MYCYVVLSVTTTSEPVTLVNLIQNNNRKSMSIRTWSTPNDCICPNN